MGPTDRTWSTNVLTSRRYRSNSFSHCLSSTFHCLSSTFHCPFLLDPPLPFRTAFPRPSTAFPHRLSSRPSSPPSRHRRQVVAAAGDRGIRVIPEVDMPGHAGSIGVGRPDVVVDCTPVPRHTHLPPFGAFPCSPTAIQCLSLCSDCFPLCSHVPVSAHKTMRRS